jgi:DNA primase
MPGNDSSWVDFREVKAQVSIEQVLEHYGLLAKFTRKGDRLSGPCPIHQGSNAKQFSASVSKGAWKCFSGHCGKSGNVIDLVAALEEVPFREAAKKLQQWFEIKPEKEKPETDNGAPQRKIAKKAVKAAAEEPEEEAPEEVKENKPLTFQLNLDVGHPYLASRGLTPETVGHFSLGLCNRGSMKGRIAIPIHNAAGELVAYAGRWVGADEELPEDEGKYKLPAGFHKGLVVYNLHRIPEGSRQLILVEGFFSVFWLHQQGFMNVASAMGSSVSPEQVELLAGKAKGVVVFFDGDEAGFDGAKKAAAELAEKVWAKIIHCPEGKQPDLLTPEELGKLLR